MKLILTFVDEKKGTIKFVTPFFQSSSYLSINYISLLTKKTPNNIMYARTSIYNYIAFLSALYNTQQITRQKQEKTTGQLILYIRRFITFGTDF